MYVILNSGLKPCGGYLKGDLHDDVAACGGYKIRRMQDVYISD
jgi:hypothetical protein